jgi:hypothetical protein
VLVTNGWTAASYRWFRLALGLYLVVHFVQLLPWGAELFSSHGALPDATASPLAFAFPNLLSVWDAPGVVAGVLLATTAASFGLALGFHDRVSAVLVWYAWACLFGRNPLIGNPGLPYVGWMLLAHACLPALPGPPWTRRASDAAWRMHGGIYAAAWILMAVGYSYSGLAKLGSPSWVDGTALRHVLENPLARPGVVRDALASLPPLVLTAATWAALFLEIGCAPLALVRPLRPWVWAALLGMHLGLIVAIDFADLSLGMVMLHLFTFDPDWLRGYWVGWRRHAARRRPRLQPATG